MLEFLKNYRRFILIATISVVAIFAASFLIVETPQVLAQSEIEETFEDVGETIRLPDKDIRVIIATIIRYVIMLLGVVFLGLIIYGGVLFMTSKGEADNITKAKRVLTNAAIGLAIVLASYAIASFILNALLGAVGMTSGTGSNTGVEPLSGSLGSGIIEDHWPVRNAIDIPRNTNIIITFKEPMFIESFGRTQLTGVDTPDTSDDTWTLETDNIKIYDNSLGEAEHLTAEEVVVASASEGTIWVFNPENYLGNAITDTDYTVALKPGILTANGEEAFTGMNDNGYEWSFEVSTEIDLTPPYITSVQPPDESERARNVVVQINFSEAIDPTSATGVYDGVTYFFSNILAEYAEHNIADEFDPVNGTWSISNGYKTVEFVTFYECGEDPCGDSIYCLPESSYIKTTASAATLGDEPPQAAGFPYDGVADVAANSLDGNHDGEAQGPDEDNYDWTFYATDEINSIVPTIHTILPIYNEEEIGLDAPVEITFTAEDEDGVTLMSSTLTTSNISITPRPEEHEMWYRIEKNDLYSGYADAPAQDGDVPVATEVVVDHMNFLESDETITYIYYTEATQGVKSAYQICMFPSDGPESTAPNTTSPPWCGVDSTDPSCCHGSSSEDCIIPAPTE
jgi:hypothetical protein